MLAVYRIFWFWFLFLLVAQNTSSVLHANCCVHGTPYVNEYKVDRESNDERRKKNQSQSKWKTLTHLLIRLAQENILLLDWMALRFFSSAPHPLEILCWFDKKHINFMSSSLTHNSSVYCCCCCFVYLEAICVFLLLSLSPLSLSHRKINVGKCALWGSRKRIDDIHQKTGDINVQSSCFGGKSPPLKINYD